MPEPGDGGFVDRARRVGAGRRRRDRLADRAHDDQGVATPCAPGGDDTGHVDAGPLGEQRDEALRARRARPGVWRTVRSTPRYQRWRHRSASSWASPASRPYTLTSSGPPSSVPSNSTTPSRCIDAGARSSTTKSEVAEGEPDSRNGRATTRRTDGEVDERRGEQAQRRPPPIRPTARAAPSRIAPTNCSPISQLAEVPERPGDDAAKPSTSPQWQRRRSTGGNTGGPSTSNSRSAKPVPSFVTIAATAAAPATDRTIATMRSRTSARRPRDDGDDEDHERPCHRHPEQQLPQRVEESQARSTPRRTSPARAR